MQLRRADLVAVVLLFATAAGVAAPAVAKTQGDKDRDTTLNNLKQMALACHAAHDTYKKMPMISGALGGKTSGTLHYHLLPFVEQMPTYNANNLAATIGLMHNPGDRSGPRGGVYKDKFGTTNYAANWLVFKGGPTAPNQYARIPASFPDGTSNTILFAERYQMCNGTPCLWGYDQFYYWAPMFNYYSLGKFQAHPPQEQCNPALAQGLFRNGIAIALADGSTRIVSNDISPLTWGLACHPADGMLLPGDWNQ